MTLIRTAIARPITVWMGILTLLLFGMVGFSRLAVTLLPEMNYPTLTIRTLYPGAAPVEVEQLVSKPIEEAVGIVKGLRRLSSTSRAGLSDIQLEFEWGTDMDLAALDTREKLDAILLPLDIDKPLILRFNPNLDPVMRLGVQTDASDEASLIALRSWADDDLKRQLEAVPGVASVRPSGGLVREVQILVDQDKLAQLNLSPDELVQRINAENINLSAGKLTQGSEELLVRTLNQFDSVDALANVIVYHQQGRQVRLRDVAEVRDGFAERTDISRVDGEDAVELSLYKEGDANAVQVANAVHAKLAELAKRPNARTITVLYDQSRFIQGAIDEVTSAAVIGAVLAMLVIYLFLRDIRPTLIISLSIPISVVATFNLMYFADISLNLMSLGGIALAVGLLVDNAIVVLENIDRQRQLAGNSEAPQARAEAARKGTAEVAGAITASTLTTLAVFVPLLFVEGVAGALFGDQALTVAFALVASLLVALTAIPMLAGRRGFQWPKGETRPKRPLPDSRWGRTRHYATTVFSFPFSVLFRYIPALLFTLGLILGRAIKRLAGALFAPLAWLFQKLYGALAWFYPHLLALALRQRAVTLLLALAITGTATALLPRLGMELIPPMNQGEFYLEVQLPPGTDVRRTDEVLNRLAQSILSDPAVHHAYSQAGSAALLSSASSRSGENWGRLQVVLADADAQASVMATLRQTAARIPDLETELKQPQLLTFKQPLAIELAGYDLDHLKQASTALAKALGASPRFSDVTNSLRDGQPELAIHFDHARLAALGLTAPDVASRLATLVGGTVASRYTLADRKIDIRLRADEATRDQLDDIRALIVNPGARHPVPLDAVATIEQSIGPAAINRIAQQRVAIVSAGLAEGTLSEGVDAAQQLVQQLALPAGIQITFGGQNEEMEQSSQSLKIALLLAVFLVYIVMASQFESLLHPLLILAAVPMALAGSVLGLWLTGTPLSVLVFIGLIMLCGIVVNNAIVLVDRINQLRGQGLDRIAAIEQAAASRLRPILMTTLTTTLGLLPMLLGLGEGAELRAPMAITVIFGLGLSTLLTLVVLPVLYAVFDHGQRRQPDAEVQHG
ncbi:acriflavin resistance protein [Ferrimonas balearica DSM 9799]|uniref:Acriflavin resistance protein n=1 Tax=Ferrimonas balearica (strain DSM 9799 / CCM 4581 / KCTC 23876 / PAT) TaxID=550540 RepID=E1SNM3_FERBD|nr:efflux RND transporter permease subunit [Ferrimonas balearica]ADN76696.1 acriflavin resistance protein [Ferrimonas balearica DSM 9799]